MRVSAAAVALLVLAAPPARALVNTGQDASLLPFVACNGRVGFRTAETQQGQTDLNGDADSFDFDLRILTLSSGMVTDLGLDATGPLACGGDRFAFGVYEFNQGATDLNADGDALDTILHVWDAGLATLTSTGLPVVEVAASPTLIAFGVPEADIGPSGTDLNADGDALDVVLHVYDPITTLVTNVGVDASGGIAVSGNAVAFRMNEANQGNADANGDFDALDFVLRAWDQPTATLFSSSRAAEPDFQFENGVAAFNVSELAQSVPLNADIDTSDLVLHLYCLPGAVCAGGPGTVNVNVDAGGGFTLAGDLVAFRARERNQLGVSLNGDLDLSDWVAHVYRIGTGVLTNTGLAAASALHVVGNDVAIAVPERRQNKTDLTADGDTRDVVLHIWDAGTATVTNTGLALSRKSCLPRAGALRVKGPCMAAAGDTLLFAVSERDSAKTDLNGDGDFKDVVAQARRFSTGAVINTGKAVRTHGPFVAAGDLGVFRVWEKGQNTVLNGDADLKDQVIAAVDVATGTTTVVGQAAEDLFLLEANRVVFRTAESAQGTNLNGDADQGDAVLQYE